MKKHIFTLLCLLLCASFLLPTVTGCAGTGADPDNGQNTGDHTGEDADGEGGDKSARAPIGNPSALGAQSSEDSILPTIYINTDSGASIRTKVYQPSTVSIKDATIEEQNITNAAAEVKCRGNFTYSGTEKKSFRLKFAEKINLFGQGSGEAKSWVLLAEHCDQTFMRNHLAFAMANILDNIPYVSSSSFVHLYINGKDQGIYHVAEQHQVGKYRVNINEDENEVDSDYFIEWDAYASDEGSAGIDYFDVDGNHFLIKSDYEMTYEKCSFLSEFFNDAYEAIKDGDQAEIEKYIDLPSFIDMYLLQEIVKNIDVGWSSFFFVKKAGDKIYCTCPWDFDLSLGNDNRLDDGSYEGMYVGNSEYAFGWGALSQGNEWLCYLMRQRWFVDLVYARWKEKSEQLKTATLNEIDRIYTCFGDEIAANFEIWPIFGQRINQEPYQIMELDTYKAHVDHLRDWVTKRFAWMTTYFSRSTTRYQTTEYKEWDWGGGWWGPWRD